MQPAFYTLCCLRVRPLQPGILHSVVDRGCRCDGRAWEGKPLPRPPTDSSGSWPWLLGLPLPVPQACLHALPCMSGKPQPAEDTLTGLIPAHVRRVQSHPHAVAAMAPAHLGLTVRPPSLARLPRFIPRGCKLSAGEQSGALGCGLPSERLHPLATASGRSMCGVVGHPLAAALQQQQQVRWLAQKPGDPRGLPPAAPRRRRGPRDLRCKRYGPV